MKKYFIETRFLSARNKLEKQLQEAFRSFDRKIISQDNLEIIHKKYDEVVHNYKMGGGRSGAPYSYCDVDSALHISMGDQVTLTLVVIKGEVTA